MVAMSTHPTVDLLRFLGVLCLKCWIKHFKGLRNPCPLVTVLLTLSKKMTPHGASLVRSTVPGCLCILISPRWPCLPSRCGRHSSIVPTLVGREDAQRLALGGAFGLSLLSCQLPLLGSRLTLEPEQVCTGSHGTDYLGGGWEALLGMCTTQEREAP